MFGLGRLLRVVWVAAVLSGWASLACAGNGEIGIVVMHGKWGNPSSYTLKFAKALAHEGYAVDSPEMVWSARRAYGEGLDAMMKDIDAAIARLRAQGATKIFLAGHSLGAAGALRYAGQNKVDGVIVLAPGHFPESKSFRGALEASVKKAREMVQAGQGAAKAWFDDINTGNRSKQISMSANTYLAFFDPDGPMNFSANAAALKPDTPVLWVVGAGESPGLKANGTRVYENKLPKTAHTQLIEVPGGHEQTPDHAIEPALAWLKEVAQ